MNHRDTMTLHRPEFLTYNSRNQIETRHYLDKAVWAEHVMRCKLAFLALEHLFSSFNLHDYLKTV